MKMKKYVNNLIYFYNYFINNYKMKLNINNCYKFEKYIYDDSLFNNVDVTYILHLENNGRYNNIIEQLNKYHLTNIVYIVFNKGYKKCNKNKNIRDASADILYSYIQIFNHAKINNYDNILILEDDFIINNEIVNKYHINNISDFLSYKKDTKFLYALGCSPIIQLPYLFNSSFIPLFVCLQGIIYSKKLYYELIEKYINNKINIQIDVYLWKNNYLYNYMYNIPLVYQTFPETESRKVWGRNLNSDKSDNSIMTTKVSDCFINLLNLDKNYEPGFTIIYSLSKSLSFILFFILFFIIKKFIVLYNGIK